LSLILMVRRREAPSRTMRPRRCGTGLILRDAASPLLRDWPEKE
jgi:hypothetical protein